MQEKIINSGQFKGMLNARAIIEKALTTLNQEIYIKNQVQTIPTDLESLDVNIAPNLAINKRTILLDAGSGRGFVALYFAMKYGIKTYGYEIDPKQHNFAQRLKQMLVEQGYIREERVTLINDDIANADFSRFNIVYYHSPLLSEVDSVVNRKIVNELPINSQVIDTLGRLNEFPSRMVSEEKLQSEPDPEFGIVIVYATVRTKINNSW